MADSEKKFSFDATRRKCSSEVPELILCWGAGARETGVEDSGGSPMVDVQMVERNKMRGGEIRIERLICMAAETQDSNEKEEIVSTRTW